MSTAGTARLVATITEMQMERGWSNDQLVAMLARLIVQIAEEGDDPTTRKEDDRA